MSILIPGMEMPTSCFQCEFRTKIDPDNLMCIISQKTFEDRFYHIEHRDTSCPLVPVPPHGDLIDRDAATEKIWDDMRFPSNLANAQFFVNELREMPTIISVDPPKEGEG